MAIFGAFPAGAYQTPPFIPPQQPEGAFLWGAGGQRMTPEEIAFNRRLGAQQALADYSPIQSPWQGLARVAGNITGALRERGAERAAQDNASADARITQAILGQSSPVQGGAMPSGAQSPASGGINPAVIAALSDPYASDAVKSLAMDQYKLATKHAEPIEINGKLVDPATMTVLGDFSSEPEIVRVIRASGVDPSSPQGQQLLRQYTTNRVDPIQGVPVYNADGSQGLQFIRPSQMGGGQRGLPPIGTIVDQLPEGGDPASGGGAGLTTPRPFP